MKKDVNAAVNEHKRCITQDFGGVLQDFAAIRKEVADLQLKTTRLQGRLGRHCEDIDRNRDCVDSVEVSFNDLETVLWVSEQNLAIALQGHCHCTNRALEDLEPLFVDDPAPGLTQTGSSLSYLSVSNTSTPELEEFGAPPENVVPVPIRQPSIPAETIVEHVVPDLVEAQFNES